MSERPKYPGQRVVNFTSGQGIVYRLEQYDHAPGKVATRVVKVAARALTRHALNVQCGQDDIYAALDTGWIMLMARDAQQAADQALILRRVTELSLTPGMNIQDGFLEQAYEEFTTLTGRRYGPLREYKTDDVDTVFLSLGSAAESIEAAVDYLEEALAPGHPAK